MLTRILKKKPKKSGRQASNSQVQQKSDHPYTDKELQQMSLSSNLDQNLELLKTIIGQSDDVVFRRFQLGMTERTKAAVVFVENMVEKGLLNRDVLKPLMMGARQGEFFTAGTNFLEILKNFVINVSDCKEISNLNDMVTDILSGDVILLVEGHDKAMVIDLTGWVSRNISEPETEIVVRGPRDGFTENMETNLSLIRRRLKSPNLVIEESLYGRVTKTKVSIAYIRGITSPGLEEEVKQRLKRIDLDGILESGYLEELIEDNPFSPFPQVVHTERPDRVVAAMLEGRLAILTEGTPFAMIVPSTFVSFLQSAEDYYEGYMMGSAVRLLRFLAFAISLLLPSIYIAITTFHQEMIPTRLLISVSAGRSGVPFPGLLEALLMEVTFEALREAGIRMPRAVGQAVSIVGALVIGQAAVQASIVSPLMVIVVAITGICSFAIPAYNIGITMRMLRFPMMLLAGVLGLFGVVTALLAIIIHLAGLRTFGVPYLSSLAPYHAGDNKDFLVRAPWWAMTRRPVETGERNRRRQGQDLKPAPPATDGQQGEEKS